ncbi:2Fe-2S iron-sulfur cluster binding domain-containing protein [Mycolicibacterium peregrinum]|jgi:ferredoxin|uniref:2Fe-2S iron-sulfur cluster binding domain-containing protein n=2 Tax=Mycolicibacterium peregrinum TaxID=43304 RepID=A0A4Z0HW05_MYCPR|nr:2Fe-2S iron-sulfur cluster binding domain-containing protein [Mycolicibacterium peregrinum]TGB46512.1 2Fe-2S iron-sulfur cluster binding domain-containing protein [Mycolicibacterium peregrinum]
MPRRYYQLARMVFSSYQNVRAQGSYMTAGAMAGSEADGKVTIVFDREQLSVPRREGETLLESARRAGMTPPFSCEAGNCGTCMAKILEGTATMRVNDALDDDEVADGYVLTCQAVPDCASVTVSYDED